MPSLFQLDFVPQLQATVTGHSYRLQLQVTVTGRSYRSQLQVAVTGHSVELAFSPNCAAALLLLCCVLYWPEVAAPNSDPQGHQRIFEARRSRPS